MKLFDILKERGLFSKEIKTRFRNNQVKVNGITVDSDFEFDSIKGIQDPGEVISFLIKNEKWKLQLDIIGLDNIMESNIETDLKDQLQKFQFVRTSKKDFFVVVNHKN